MRVSLAATAAILVTFACADQPLTSPDALSVSPNFDANPVTDMVSAGSNDACESAFGLPKGCDGNFSFHANLREDGSVKGQYQDTFAGGGLGVHATLDCLNIVGNGAVVGGVITNGTSPGQGDVTGRRLLAAVVDNGKSANDPADQISFSLFRPADEDPAFCQALVPEQFQLFDLTTGQVTVKSK